MSRMNTLPAELPDEWMILHRDDEHATEFAVDSQHISGVIPYDGFTIVLVCGEQIHVVEPAKVVLSDIQKFRKPY